jgi:hypothetical protein
MRVEGAMRREARMYTSFPVHQEKTDEKGSSGLQKKVICIFHTLPTYVNKFIEF